MVRPFFNFINNSQIARRAYGSTPAVGSSKIMVLASPTNALESLFSHSLFTKDEEETYIATDSFLFIPPDNVETVELRFAVKPTSSNILKRTRRETVMIDRMKKTYFSTIFFISLFFTCFNLEKNNKCSSTVNFSNRTFYSKREIREMNECLVTC